MDFGKLRWIEATNGHKYARDPETGKIWECVEGIKTLPPEVWKQAEQDIKDGKLPVKALEGMRCR